MSRGRDSDKRIARPVDELPVLTEEVSVLQAGAGSSAQVDALVAQIERSVLEELTPRLEDAVHHAVRAALEQALAAPSKAKKTP